MKWQKRLGFSSVFGRYAVQNPSVTPMAMLRYLPVQSFTLQEIFGTLHLVRLRQLHSRRFQLNFRRVLKIVICECWLRHVRPSLRAEELGSHWMDFHEILYLRIFRKSVEKIQVLLKSEKNNG
jgi:hypothetical protein